MRGTGFGSSPVFCGSSALVRTALETRFSDLRIYES